MIKYFKYAAFAIAALVVMAVIALLAFLRNGVISNDELGKLLEASLSAPDAGITTSIGSASMRWRNITDFGVVHVSQAVLRDENGEIFANFPELQARFDPISWVMGGRKFSELKLLRPQFYVQRDETGHWRLGLDKAGQATAITDLIAAFGSAASQNAQTVSFERLAVVGAQIYISEHGSESLLVSTGADILAHRGDQTIELQLHAPFTYNDIESHISAGIVLAENGTSIIGELRAQTLPLALICQYMKCPQGVGVSGSFTGQIKPVISQGTLSNLALIGGVQNARITLPKTFKEPLIIKKSNVNLQYDAETSKVEIARLEMLNDDTHVALRGKIFTENGAYGAQLYGEALAPLAMDKLSLYWPLTLAPETRGWVVKNLSKGVVSDANVTINVKPGDLDLADIPDAMVDADIQMKGLQVQFLQGFPVAESVSGKVHFTGRTMHIEAREGTYLTDSRITFATLDSKDLFHPDTPMSALLRFDASAKDAARFLAIKQFTFDDRLALNAKTITGKLDGEALFHFNASSEASIDEVDLSKVKYALDISLHDIAQTNFANQFDLSGFSGKLKAKPADISLNGDAALNGNLLHISLAQKAAKPMHAQIKGDLPVSLLKQKISLLEKYLGQGGIGVDADFSYADDQVRLHSATLDLSKTSVEIPELTFSKPLNDAGKIIIKKTSTQDAQDKVLFEMSMGELQAKGHVEMRVDGGLQAIEIAALSTPTNNFHARYEDSADGLLLSVGGARLNAENAYASQENSLLANFPSLKLELDLQELVLVQGYPLNDLQGTLDCLRQKCRYANFSGIVGKGNIAVSIGQKEDGRHLEIYSGDAGDLLRALDISDRVFGGKLELKGRYDDSQLQLPLNSRLIIEDFTMKNSQIFARLFSVASLTGLANLLTGSGIAFDKLSADLLIERGLVTIHDGRAQGNSMGLTAEGTLDTSTTKLAIKGVLVPAFFVNSLVGNIPIIGELAGGKGEGIIAFNYKVGGNYQDPQTSVNPLSGLMPGFLRNIFNIFDAPASRKKEKAKTPPKRIAK
jgi:hypothetical protein